MTSFLYSIFIISPSFGSFLVSISVVSDLVSILLRREIKVILA
jgi:hypothetical protein